ncbi:MAG: class I SAM-dependent methyltransferase [Vitreimonas sp.]
MTASDARDHWDRVYVSKRSDEASWFQAMPALSLALIRRTGVGRGARIVDVGGGASTLVDHALEEGFCRVSVLDVSAEGLNQAKRRLGARADAAEWIVADVTAWRPEQRVDLWHDRAVLHFLTSPRDQAAYAETLCSALGVGGWAIVGGFAPGGPAQCSGLPVVQHDATSLGRLLGDAFTLLETHGQVHLTPSGAEQAFRFHVFRRDME